MLLLPRGHPALFSGLAWSLAFLPRGLLHHTRGLSCGLKPWLVFKLCVRCEIPRQVCLAFSAGCSLGLHSFRWWSPLLLVVPLGTLSLSLVADKVFSAGSLLSLWAWVDITSESKRSWTKECMSEPQCLHHKTGTIDLPVGMCAWDPERSLLSTYMVQVGMGEGFCNPWMG